MIIRCTSSLCVSSSHLTHNSTWSVSLLEMTKLLIVRHIWRSALRQVNSLEHYCSTSLCCGDDEIYNLYVLRVFSASHHFTHKLKYHWGQENSTELGLFDSNVYTILMVSRQAVVFTEEIKFQSLWRHWLISVKEYPFQSSKLDCHSHHGWSHCLLLL